MTGSKCTDTKQSRGTSSMPVPNIWWMLVAFWYKQDASQADQISMRVLGFGRTIK